MENGKQMVLRPTLSVLILAQNVEQLLPAVFANVRALADEIVVVDGGSLDGTAGVAQKEPQVRLFERRFQGDFAAQKNYGLERCRGHWVLIVDADELLSDTLRARIPRLISSRRRRWYKLPRYWVVSPTPPFHYVRSPLHYPDYQLRLFRNEAPFRYCNTRPVHEHFPREGRGCGKRLAAGHIFHLAFALTSRAQRQARAARYAGLFAASAGTNQIYLYEDHPHEILSCREKLSAEFGH